MFAVMCSWQHKKIYKIYIKHLVSESWGWWSVHIGPFYIPDYGRMKRVIGLLDVFLCKRKTALLCATTVTFLSYMFIYVLVVIKIHCAELTTFDSLWSMPSLLSTTTLTLSAITSLGAVLQLSTTFVWLYVGYWMLVLSIFYISQRLTLWYFVFLYLIFLSQQVLYFLLSTLVLTLYIEVVLSLSIKLILQLKRRLPWFVHEIIFRNMIQ